VAQDRWSVKFSSFQAVNFSACQYVETQAVDFVRLRSLEISHIDLRFSTIFNYKSVIIQTPIITQLLYQPMHLYKIYTLKH